MSRGPNVRLSRGMMVHDAKARAGRTGCGRRFVLYARVAREWGHAYHAVETTDEVDCMACIAAGQED